MRIAISGKQGAGKSELAKALIEKYGFEHLSFAKAVKETAMKEYGLSYEEAFGSQKNRLVLQKIGAEKREEDPDYWVKKVINSLEEDKDYVIDDLRYKNEYDYLKEAGFVMCRLIASEKVRQERIPGTFGNPTHISETDLDDTVQRPVHYSQREPNKRYWDILILNETIGLERLRGCADSIYKSYLYQDNV